MEDKRKDVSYYISFILGLILLVFLCVLTSCSTIKEVPINTVEKVVVKDTTIFIKDTVTVEVPREVVKEIVPADTTSILRTSVALSEARIHNGSLHHKLTQKGVIKTKIDTVFKVQYVDKIIEKEVPVTVEVEKKHIPNWCWYSLIFNIVILLITCFKIYLKFIFYI